MSVTVGGVYDAARRRLAQRSGRYRGCKVYIPAEELEKAGFGGDEPPPYYRTWGTSRGVVIVRLYRNP